MIDIIGRLLQGNDIVTSLQSVFRRHLLFRVGAPGVPVVDTESASAQIERIG